MKTTIERQNMSVTISVSDEDTPVVDDLLSVIEDCILGLGYRLNGQLQVESVS